MLALPSQVLLIFLVFTVLLTGRCGKLEVDFKSCWAKDYLFRTFFACIKIQPKYNEHVEWWSIFVLQTDKFLSHNVSWYRQTHGATFPPSSCANWHILESQCLEMTRVTKLYSARFACLQRYHYVLFLRGSLSIKIMETMTDASVSQKFFCSDRCLCKYYASTKYFTRDPNYWVSQGNLN